jgi:hypothetical protein
MRAIDGAVRTVPVALPMLPVLPVLPVLRSQRSSTGAEWILDAFRNSARKEFAYTLVGLLRAFSAKVM